MKSDIHLRPLYTEGEIHKRLIAISQEIAESEADNELLVAGLLTGSFVFIADLIRELCRRSLSLHVDFMDVSSYGSGTESSGNIVIGKGLTSSVKGRHVLIVDDILDTGRTLEFVVEYIEDLQPASVATCVFLDKPERRVVEIEADYVGFRVEDRFIVGYGLDYGSRYRELPYLATVEFESGN